MPFVTAMTSAVQAAFARRQPYGIKATVAPFVSLVQTNPPIISVQQATSGLVSPATGTKNGAPLEGTFEFFQVFANGTNFGSQYFVGLSANITGLSNGVTYEVQTRMFPAIQSGVPIAPNTARTGLSPAVSISIPAVPVVTITQFYKVQNYSNQYFLSWSVSFLPANASIYVVYISDYYYDINSGDWVFIGYSYDSGGLEATSLTGSVSPQYGLTRQDQGTGSGWGQGQVQLRTGSPDFLTYTGYANYFFNIN